jgi:import inner membrane translocase subunit TIM16
MKYFINILTTVAPKVFSSVKSAYSNVVRGAVHREGDGPYTRSGKPITKEEAYNILGFKDKQKVTPQDIIKKFDHLYESNGPEKGGSLYLQAKIYHARQHLMKEFSPIYNTSKFDNPKDQT